MIAQKLSLDMDSSADILRQARARAGLSQRQLAERAGTTQSVVARIENGSVAPLVQTLANLVAAAGLRLRISLDAGEPGALASTEQSHELTDVSRILALTPEQRLQELANASRFFALATRV